MIISVHVHKTAGRSFNEYLKGAYGTRLYRVHQDKSLTVRHRLNEALGMQKKRKEHSIGSEHECIHGHFKATRFLEDFPDAKLAIWLRDPLQRAVSHYYFMRRDFPYVRRFIAPIVPEKVGLQLFIRCKPFGDLYDRFLDGVSIKRFDFIGLTEDYDRSLLLFQRIFGLPETKTSTETVNVNPKRQGDRYDVGRGLESYFHRHYHADMLIYEQAKARYKELCKKHSV